MSLPDKTPALPPSFGLSTHLIPTGEPRPHEASTGPSIQNPASCLEHDFNFDIVVFEVENRLFKVVRNGFNVPGTPFEAMFTLPQAQTDTGSSIEGSSLENPIHLPGIKVDHFRSFLRVLYPFIGQKPVVEYDEWVGVLNLATMWLFQEIRERAITKLSDLIKLKTVFERIALAREYRVVEWLRDAYLELTQKEPLDFEELRPAELYANRDPLDKNREATPMDWETLARISNLQAKVATSIMSLAGNRYHCNECAMHYGGSYPEGCLCKCRLLAMVDEAFREELKSYPGYVELPSPLLLNSTVTGTGWG